MFESNVFLIIWGILLEEIGLIYHSARFDFDFYRGVKEIAPIERKDLFSSFFPTVVGSSKTLSVAVRAK